MQYVVSHKLHTVGELLMGFQDGEFLATHGSFPPHFLNIVAKVKIFGAPHALKQWLGVSKIMLPVKFLCTNKASFFVSVESHGDHKAKVNQDTLCFWDITGLKLVVSVCYSGVKSVTIKF